MKIKITNYSEGLHQIFFDEPAEKLSLDCPFFDKLKISILMDKSRSQIILKCELNVKAKLTCDRCDEEFEYRAASNFNLTYLFNEKEEKGLEQPDVYYLSPETDTIDVSKDTSEYALLTLPMKCLCSDECKGLCAKCGKNLNLNKCECVEETANPMWEPLKKLKNDIN